MKTRSKMLSIKIMGSAHPIFIYSWIQTLGTYSVGRLIPREGFVNTEIGKLSNEMAKSTGNEHLQPHQYERANATYTVDKGAWEHWPPKSIQIAMFWSSPGPKHCT